MSECDLVHRHFGPPANHGPRIHVQYSMRVEANISAQTIERLEKQSRLLLRKYQAELAKDPASPATESARSNMIALHHSIKQIYGDTATLEVNSDLASAVGR